MIGKLLSAACLAVAMLLAACSKPVAQAEKKTEVKGQVFVVQRNSLTVKLGGVDVHYLPREVVEAECREVRAKLPRLRQVADYEKRLKRIDLKIEDAYRDRHSSKVRDFLESAIELQSDARKRFEEDSTIRGDLALISLAEAYREESAQAGFSRSDEDLWAAHSLLKLRFAKDVIKAKSDADGNYTLNVSAPADGYIVAESSRQLSESVKEVYYWMEKVSPSATGPVHLTSLNLFEVNDLEEMLSPSSTTDPGEVIAIEEKYKLRDLSWFVDAEDLLNRIRSNEAEVEELRSSTEDVEASIERAKYMEVDDIEMEEE